MVLGVSVMIVVIGLMVFPYFKQIDRSNKLLHFRSSAVLIKESLMSAIDNEAAWAEMVALNPALACLATNGLTCPAGPISFNVYDADGTLILDSANPVQGFDLAGKPCSTFDPVNGHQLCVFKYTVTAQCSGACGPTVKPPGALVALQPKMEIRTTFQFSPVKEQGLREALRVDSNRYSSKFIRGSKTGTLSKYCNSLNGVYDATTLDCQVPGATPGEINCETILGPHAWLVGMNADGTPQCANDSKVDAACGPTQAIVGYLDDGTFRCSEY